MLIVFDDMIADMLDNKKLNPIVTELIIRGRKLNISLGFVTQFYFSVPRNIRLNSTDYFVMKIPSKRKVRQIAFNHSSYTDFQDFMKLSRNHILFWLLILLLHQIILFVWERISHMEYDYHIFSKYPSFKWKS